LRYVLRGLERSNPQRQPRRNPPHPRARRIAARLFAPSHAIVILRGTSHVLGPQPWQSREKQNIQRPIKTIHLPLRFRYRWAGMSVAKLAAYACELNPEPSQGACLSSCVHSRGLFARRLPSWSGERTAGDTFLPLAATLFCALGEYPPQGSSTEVVRGASRPLRFCFSRRVGSSSRGVPNQSAVYSGFVGGSADASAAPLGFPMVESVSTLNFL
jgi:hypothetical protein